MLAGGYAIDDRNIYYADGSYWRIVNSAMHHGATVSSVVDRASFEVLGAGFARDRERVYWQNDVLLGVAHASFAPLSRQFGRDDARAYYFYPGIHRSVFADGRYRGIEPIVLPGADPRTFVALNELCAKDA